MDSKGDLNSRNFTYLDNLVNSQSEITLDSDIILSADEESKYCKGLRLGIRIKGVSKNITIDGNGHTIDARSKGIFFDIRKKLNIHLKNIHFKNGGTGKVTPIYCAKKSCRFEFTNCTFENNNKTFSFYESDVILRDCRFVDNIQIFQSGLPSKNTTVFRMENCTFKNNSQIIHTGSVNAVNCVFENNNAVHAYSPSTHNPNKNPALFFNQNFSNCTFRGNYDAFVNENANISFVECVFDNNSSEFGGVIYNKVSCSFTKCSSTNNSAKYAGVIFNGKDGHCTVNDSSFEGNHAEVAGAILNEPKMRIALNKLVGSKKVSGGKLFFNGENRFSDNTNLNEGKEEINSLMDIPNGIKF